MISLDKNTVFHRTHLTANMFNKGHLRCVPGILFRHWSDNSGYSPASNYEMNALAHFTTSFGYKGYKLEIFKTSAFILNTIEQEIEIMTSRGLDKLKYSLDADCSIGDLDLLLSRISPYENGQISIEDLTAHVSKSFTVTLKKLVSMSHGSVKTLSPYQLEEPFRKLGLIVNDAALTVCSKLEAEEAEEKLAFFNKLRNLAFQHLDSSIELEPVFELIAKISAAAGPAFDMENIPVLLQMLHEQQDSKQKALFETAHQLLSFAADESESADNAVKQLPGSNASHHKPNQNKHHHHRTDEITCRAVR